MKVYSKVVRNRLSNLLQSMKAAPILNGFINMPAIHTNNVFNAVDKNGNVWFVTTTNEVMPTETKVSGRTNLLFTDASIDETNMVSVYEQAEITTIIPTTNFKAGKELRDWMLSTKGANTIAIKVTPDEACFWNADTFAYETLFKLENMGVITLGQENTDIALSA